MFLSDYMFWLLDVDLIFLIFVEWFVVRLFFFW